MRSTRYSSYMRTQAGEHHQHGQDEHISQRGITRHDHRHRRGADDDRGPQVGLEDDEAPKHADREDHRDEEVAKSCQQPMLLLEDDAPGPATSLLTTSEGWKAESCDRQPPLRAADDGPDGEHRDEEADVTEAKASPAVDPIRDSTGYEEGHGPDTDAHQLALEEVEAIRLVDGHRRRSRLGGATPITTNTTASTSNAVAVRLFVFSRSARLGPRLGLRDRCDVRRHPDLPPL